MNVPIVQAGVPVLRQRARELQPTELGTPELGALVETMIATMRAAPGVGLAAPQIGADLRVIVLEERDELLSYSTPGELVECERVAFETRVFVNPVLRLLPGPTATFFEGCLSVDGYVGLVERHLEVEVSGLDLAGAPQVWRVRGWPARILQHEVDHLNGMLYVDRMITRSFASSAVAKERFKGKPIAEIRALLGV